MSLVKRCESSSRAHHHSQGFQSTLKSPVCIENLLPPGTSSVVWWLRFCFCCRSLQVQSLVREVTLLHSAAKRSLSIPSDQRRSAERPRNGKVSLLTSQVHSWTHSSALVLWTSSAHPGTAHTSPDTILVQPHDAPEVSLRQRSDLDGLLPGSGQALGAWGLIRSQLSQF